MDQAIKKNIRLLSERYNHKIDYGINELSIISAINSIKIYPKSKYGFEIEYNTDKETKQIGTNTTDIYDVLIELLRRIEPYELIPRNGKLLGLNDWIEQEQGNWLLKYLKRLKTQYENKEIKVENIGGNRYELEFFNGILILIDDIRLDKSNVIDIDNAVQQCV